MYFCLRGVLSFKNASGMVAHKWQPVAAALVASRLPLYFLDACYFSFTHTDVWKTTLVWMISAGGLALVNICYGE